MDKAIFPPSCLVTSCVLGPNIQLRAVLSLSPRVRVYFAPFADRRISHQHETKTLKG